MRSHQFLFQAIAQLRDVIEITPDCAPAHNNLAWLLATSADLELRQPPEAIAHALKAIELAPQARGPLNTLGVAQYRAGHWQAAIESLQKSIERAAGGDANDFFFLAMAHRQLGHQDEAKQWSRPAKIFLPRALAADVARLSHSRAASNLAQPTGSQSQILLTAALMVSGVIHDVFREKTLTHVPYAAALMKCSIIV